MAAATTITLSQVSSDSTPAGQLDATLDFTIIGGNQLQLTVTNDTGSGGDPTFDLSAIYFNGSDDVSGLTLALENAPGSWTLNTSQSADGFGTFDFELISSDDPASVIPDSAVFTFTIQGTGPFDMADFVGNDTFSTNPPGNISAQAAAKFIQCVDGTSVSCTEFDDSAFGASNGPGFPPVPEPATAVLVGLGLTALGMRRARRH